METNGNTICFPPGKKVASSINKQNVTFNNVEKVGRDPSGLFYSSGYQSSNENNSNDPSMSDFFRSSNISKSFIEENTDDIFSNVRGDFL